MTKTERAALWFKNGLERRRDKQIEEHVDYIFRRVMIGSVALLIVIYSFKYIV